MVKDFVEETGAVVRLNGDYAWVETQRRSTCQSCEVNAACGSGVLSRVLGARRSKVRVRNSLDAKVGDRVVLGLNQNAMSRGAQLVYGVPLLAMILGAVAGAELGHAVDGLNSDFVAVAFATAGLILGINVVKAYSRRLGPGFFEPEMLRLEYSASAPGGIDVVVLNGR